MTCNPKWKENDDELLEGQTPQDRPDIVSRVFKLKYDQLIDDLITSQLLGKVVANLEVVEFQKHGLPYAHILLILADDILEMFYLNTIKQFDQLEVCLPHL